MDFNTPDHKKTHSKALQSIQKTILQLIEATEAEMESSTIFSPAFSKSYSDHLLSAISHLERQLFLLRDNTGSANPDLWTRAAKTSDQPESIDLWIEPSRVTIRMPYLPHRYKGNQDSIAQMLAAKIHSCPNFPHWEVWHADFIHVVPTDLRRVPKDVDNYAYKKIIDIIAFGLHTDDSALRFDMSTTTLFSDDYEPGVYVEITPSSLTDRKYPTPIAKKAKK